MEESEEEKGEAPGDAARQINFQKTGFGELYKSFSSQLICDINLELRKRPMT